MSSRRIPFLALSLLLLTTLACNLTRRSTQEDTPPASTPNLPAVSIIAPVDGAEVQVGQQVDIRSVASDTGGGVTRVELRVDGTSLNHVEPPDGPKIYWTVQQAWIPEQAGSHTVEVIAYRGVTASPPAAITLNVRERLGPTPWQFPPGACTATVNATAGLYVRTGPSTDYPHQYTLSFGTTVAIIGRVGDNSWWQVRSTDGLVGWVSGEYVDPHGNCRDVPVVQVPPPPVPTPIPESGVAPAAPVAASPVANLQVLNIEGPAQATLPGESVTATFVVTIRNAGTGASGQFNVTFYPHGRAGSAPPQTIGFAPLNPGNVITVTFAGVYTTPGLYVVEAEVDSGRQVAESDEGDNIRTFNIQIFGPG